MSVIPNSINVSTQIAPNFTEDTFALFDPIYGIGGLREVANLTERNNISAERLRVGMLVYVTSENQFYRLVSSSEDPVSFVTTTNWENVIFLNNSGQTISGVKTFASRPTVNGTGVLLSGEAAVLPATIVYTSGNQIISGFKTFTSRPTVNGSGVLLSGETAIVYTTGDQTISGVKTFNKVPIVSGNQLITGDLSLYVKTIDLQTSTNQLVDIITGNYVTKFNGEFTNRPKVNGTGVLLSGELPSAIVHTTGNQIISGIKTFAANDNYIVISGTSDAEGLIKSLSSNLTIEGANSDYGIRFSDEGTFIHGYTEINNNLFAQTGTFQKLYADNLVYNTGAQTISGVKTFASRPKVNGTGVLLSGETTVLPATIVYTTGDQTISGIKTLISPLSAPNLVYNIGAQTISGTKTFATRPTVNGTGVLLSGEAAVLPTTIVYTTGGQTISGNKTFSQQIYIASGNGVVGGIYGTNNPDSDSHLKIVGYSTNGEESWVDIEAAANSISVGEGAIIIKNNNGGLIFNGSDNIYIDGTRNLSAENTTASFKNISVNNLLNVTHIGQQIGYISGESLDDGDISNLYIKTNGGGEKRVILQAEGHTLTLGRDGGLSYGNNQFVIDGAGENLRVQNADVYVQRNAYASNLVYNNGDQTISGAKTFIDKISLLGGGYISGYATDGGPGAEGGLLITSPTLGGSTEINIIQGQGSINLSNDYGIGISHAGGINLTNGQSSINLPEGGGIDLNGITTAKTGTFQKLYASNLVYNTGDQTISGNKNFAQNVVFGDQNQSDLLLISGETINFGALPTVNGTGILLRGEPTIVYTTGNQTINGNKFFLNDITINNLTVTGTRTITNTQESNIQSNYLLLNITGGATNGGIYFVTGAGFSGINSSGPIIAYDNNNNSFKIGTGIRSTNINALKTIAAVEDVVTLVGNQTISGRKIFERIDIKAPNGGPIVGYISGESLGDSWEKLIINGVGGPNEQNVVITSAANTIQIGEYGIDITNNNRNLNFYGSDDIYINDTRSLVGTNISASFKEVYANNLVYNAGDQTISGVKSFVNRPTVNGTGVLLSGEGAVLPSTIVYTTGDQYISGVKTFVAQNVYFSGSATQYISLGKSTNVVDLGTRILMHSGDYGLTYIGRGHATQNPYSCGIVFDGGALFTKKAYLTAGANVYATGYQYATLDWTNRILSGNWKTDKNIQVGDAYPVLTTGNQNISGIKTFSNGSNQILNTTYSELTGLKATNGLLSGQLYRISDFVLKWNNQSYNDQTVKTAASGEPLIVTALSKDKISHLAQSETYPQDTIYYNINASGSYSWGTINNNASIPDFKGWIYRRVDNLLNIDIPYDWRNITVNCCKPNVSSVPNYSGNYSYTRSDYVKETGNNSNRGKLYYSVTTGNSGNALNDTNFWNPVSSFVESGTFFSTDENNTFSALYDDVNLGDYRINLPFLTTSRIQQPTFTSTLTGLGAFTLSNVKNIKIEGGYSNVIIGDYFQNNTIGNNFYLNTIGLNFYDNTIGNTFVYNTIGNNFYLNTIGEGFSANTIGNSFQTNNIGISFNANTIGESFYANTMGYVFGGNTIGSNFAYNNIGNIFNNNIIGNIFLSNNIANNFNANTIGMNFNSNTIGNIFQSNNIVNGFVYNTIGNVFESNTIGTSFNLNNIGNTFQSNTIQTNFSVNTIANYFNSNTIGNIFQSNNIGNVFESNAVGNSFNNNISEDGFDSINFTSSTHVYNSYNTTLFRNSANSMRLRYFNSSDQLVVTDPTA